MIDFLVQVVWQIWNIFKQASIFLLFGFLLAGVLAVLIPEKALAKLFRTGKIKSVLWASAIGAPLPLCSCGVVPAALGLRKQGATPGATVAFLVATPETGLDSISLSYALMDPIVTVFRPVAAVLTAVTAGIWINLFGTRKTKGQDAAETVFAGEVASPAPSPAEASHADGHPHSHADGRVHDLHEEGRVVAPVGPRRAARRVYHYAFHQLLDDTGYWIVLGIVLSGIVAAAFPPSFFEQYLNSELASMLVMLAIGIPIYVCASEATPVAAALVMKGLNPGAALVFLLAGPATNIGSIVMLTKFLGARIMAIYLGSIIFIALLAGYALNWVYRAWGVDPRATFGTATAFIPEPVKIGGALLLVTLLVLSMRRTPVPSEWIWLRDRLHSLTGLRLTTTRITLATAAAIAVLYLASGLFSVQPGEVGVRQRFGEIVAPDLAPGLHYRLPWPLETHRIISASRIYRMEYGLPATTPKLVAQPPMNREGSIAGWSPGQASRNATGIWLQRETAPDEPFLLTGDGNLINLRWAVQYRVKDVIAYAFNIAEPDSIVRGVGLSALRDVVARSSIDAIYTVERSSVEEQVQRGIQIMLDNSRTGIQILSFKLLYVHPPDEVHDSFRDVASAQEDKLRTVNRANIFAVETVNQAKAEAAAMIEQALGFKDQQVLHAQGDAASFSLRLAAYRHAPDLTRFRLQLEAIEETLPGLPKFVTPGAGDMKDFDMWLLQPIPTSRSK